jgi:hypothetical protein
MERDRAHRTESGLDNPSGQVPTSSNVFSRRRIWRMVLVACRDLEASWEIRILRDWCFMSSCGSHRSPNLAVSLSAAALLTCCTLLIPITTTSTHNPPQNTHTHTHTQTQRIPKTTTTNSRKHSKTAHKIPAPNPKFNAAALGSDRANTNINPLSMGSQCRLSYSGNPGCNLSI